MTVFTALNVRKNYVEYKSYKMQNQREETLNNKLNSFFIIKFHG